MRHGLLGSIGSAIFMFALGCSSDSGQSDGAGRANAAPPSGPGTPTTSGTSSPGPAGTSPPMGAPVAVPTPALPSGEDGASGASDPSGPDIAPATPGQGQGEPGVLTAGTWDDNRNFDFFTSYRKSRSQLGGRLPFADQAFLDALAIAREEPPAKETLDVAFVIDTTGSMGDEISYLQAEFVALSDAISEAYPSAEQRWSLVVYRDERDLYTVRSHDFVDDVASFQATLAEQHADGGGDFPEAPDQGLGRAAQLAWRRDDATARLAFWVADAPHHQQNAGKMADAVEALIESGVHVYPVASSGVDDLSELTMRSVAQLTGGRYLFLTDDSGIGGEHKEPTLPCYFVTKLDDAILRMVDIELTGEYREPSEDQVIRTGGNPKNRRCTLESGEVVEAY